jgi:uncharacterized protein (DUF2141 family)
MAFSHRLPLAAALLALAGLVVPGSTALAQYNQRLRHDPAQCDGAGPAVRIAVTGVRSNRGNLRIQLYRATAQDWLEKGRWLNRIEVPARPGTMTVCMPVSRAGTYGIAVLHDVNGNDKTDITQDGGGASNNPSFNVFNLGKPNFRKVAFTLGTEVKPMTIRLHYL